MTQDATERQHGGQAWYGTEPVVEDLSVTANPLGTPESGLAALREGIALISRYPPADWEPARSRLCRFLKLPGTSDGIVQRVLLGNGASELIDVVVRYLAQCGSRSYVTGLQQCQYTEYKIAAKRAGMQPALHRQEADVHFLVNPNNPTGHFLGYEGMKSYINEFVRPTATVVVDESMLPWLGANWLDESLLSNTHWLTDRLDNYNIRVFVIHSWTKLWACCGLRLGSLYCSGNEAAAHIRDSLTPWNVNLLALRFLDAVVDDTEYLRKTWALTPLWRSQLGLSLTSGSRGWVMHGMGWLPWIWLDVRDARVAEQFVLAAAAGGLPVRPGILGYGGETFVRIRVCSETHQTMLRDSLIKYGLLG